MIHWYIGTYLYMKYLFTDCRSPVIFVFDYSSYSTGS